ncbi:MAG: flagellar basal-body rod protein FlgG [Pseudomonadota bacterium]
MNALQIAASGMSAQQMKVDVVSNNLANMSTTAYNTRRADFADLMYQQVQQPGVISSETGTMLPTGVQLGMGVRPSSVSVILQQGALSETGGDLDLAVQGKGYLEVTLPSGETAYTRDGALKRTADGLIVTSDGYQVNPGITIPSDAKSIAINADGEVYAYFEGQINPTQLGQFTLATFTNEKGLEASGSNLFLESAASGPPIEGAPGTEGFGTVRQGYLESSSVDAVQEITELIKAQRGYELNAKVITAVDQMMSATTQVK